MQINQFHSGSAKGDAVTNEMLFIQTMLLQHGYSSKIYCGHIGNGMKDKIFDIEEYKGNEDNIMIIHHSMGFDGFERIIKLPDKKILIYHNITPEKLFEDKMLRHYCRLGRKQLAEYKDICDAALADSNYNRQEMVKVGYGHVDVFPIQMNFDYFAEKRDNEARSIIKKDIKILFVGRVVPNKCQEQIVKVFYYYYKKYNKEASLFFVGDCSYAPYVSELKQLCKFLGIEDKVRFCGKVTNEELKVLYDRADIFLCMSEHEGFGVPLLEAMASGVPVVARRTSAIAETMDCGGIIVDSGDIRVFGEIIEFLIENKDIKAKLIKKQFERIEKIKSSDSSKILLNIINDVIRNKKRKMTLQVQGPFENTYSLAQVNRNLAEAIDKYCTNFDVSVYATEGLGDYVPKMIDVDKHQNAKRLWLKSKDTRHPDVTIRNMYPPRVNDAPGSINFLNFFWEETKLSKQYVQDFNKSLTGIGVASNFVKHVLVKAGVKVPIEVIGTGVKLPIYFENLKPYVLHTNKKIKFLHISSAFPRKGVDVLLGAYFKAFTANDNVTLIIKSFPNPHNNVQQMIDHLTTKKPNHPEVIFINKELEEKDLYSLYKAVDCYVHVARGEGFGLPVAEAMLAKIPVIVSNNSALEDFCSDKTAEIIPYEMVPAKSHLSEENSMWAEPNASILQEKLVRFANSRKSTYDEKVNAAYEQISSYYRWDKVALRWGKFINECLQNEEKINVDIVTSWNIKCGIAEYSKNIINNLPKKYRFKIYANKAVDILQPELEKDVYRCWNNQNDKNVNELIELIDDSPSKILNIQFNFGFISVENLARIIERFWRQKKIILELHAIECNTKNVHDFSYIIEKLKKVDCIIVHQQADAEVLKKYGINDNVTIIPIPLIQYKKYTAKDARIKQSIEGNPIIGTFGFLLPHKGGLELIRAIAKLKKEWPNIKLLMVCALHFSGNISLNFKKECERLIEKLNLQNNVAMITDFLELAQSSIYLQACDIICLPYHKTAESASAALKTCMVQHRPLITTKQKIFFEAQKISVQIPECSTDLIVESIQKLLRNKELCNKMVNDMDQWAEAMNINNVMTKYDAVMRK